jgi:hypothetical protein
MNIYIAVINIGEEQRQIMDRAGTGSTEINFVAIAIIIAILFICPLALGSDRLPEEATW